MLKITIVIIGGGDFVVELDRRDALIASAVLAFADSCTLPKLTPSCPFYEMVDGSPSCGEQCRNISVELGAPSRPIVSHQIGGLVMQGREIPAEIASGVYEFDAGRDFMAQRHLPWAEQSIASILVGLEGHFLRALMGNAESKQSSLELWHELARRNLPVARIAVGGLSHSMARSVASVAALPRLRELGVFSIGKGELLANESNGWYEFANSAFGEFVKANGNRTGSNLQIIIPPGLESIAENSSSLHDAVINDQYLRFVLSDRFFTKVQHWFGRLLSEDPTSVLRQMIPQVAVFINLPDDEVQDDCGRWLWDRFSVTALEDWSPRSLAKEWNWIRFGFSHDVPRRLLLVRSVPLDRIADVYFRQLAEGGQSQKPVGFDASQFVENAAQKLKDGDPIAAADIFLGLAQITPTSADAWNNLGFCLLAYDPQSALQALGRAAQFSSTNDAIRIANHMLALFLLDRSDEALLLTQVEMSHRPGSSAWVWDISSLRKNPTLITTDDSDSYLRDVIDFIRGSRRS